MENQHTPRLFLLDAYALIFRAYYALIRMPRITSSGFNTSAIFGFVNTLEELLRKENPSHIAVCFDPEGPTFRHEAFEQYKGEREATPEDIRLAVPIIKRIIEAYRIPVLEVEGFEADDVIGTMATRASEQGFVTYMMTPDKDFGQLVTPTILQYKPAYRGGEFELRGPEQVCERYGISSPRQVIDLLALMGDKIDNIPGCPGVGEKTAQKLIAEYGSVDNLIASSDTLKGALKKKVQENEEQILFSKFLATIRTDVPVAAEPAELVRREPDTELLFEIFRELEFRTLIERVKRRLKPAAPAQQPGLFDDLSEPGENTEPSEVAESSQLSETAEIIADPAALEALMTRAEREERVGLFTAAEGEADMTARILGWSLSLPSEPGKSYWIPASLPGAPEALTRIYKASTEVVSAEVKRDYVCLRNLCGREFAPGRYFDVTVAHYILNPDMRHSLPLIASSVLNLDLPTLDSVAGKKGTLSQLPADRLATYAAACSRVALMLREPLLRQIEEKQMLPLLEEIELPLIIVLADMEITGVRVDVQALNDAAADLTARIAQIESEIFELAGEEFNIGSPAKVGEILFDKMQLADKPKKTKTGQYSTSEEELEKISHLSPIVGQILLHRRLRKLLNTYLTALPTTINPATGRIHTTYNQTVTATGRISSSDPNLQNIPVREEVGREIRRAFIPSPGNVFLSADYSQIELRLVADFAGDTDMIDAFLHERDIHAITAAKIYHTTPEQVSAEQRRHAKTANFGILYGISAFGLSQRLGIPRAEAKQLIDNYFATFPTIHKYISDSIEKAREQGYVSTIHGRRRPLPDINSRNPTVRGYAERNAVNAPIQGSAADIIKIAMVRIARRMKEEQMASRMIMQVHDELNFDALPAELPRLREIVRTEMQGAYSGRVPLTASIGEGPDWLSAH